ncbi:MAG: helix-turn-helix transcriptional regulator [Larkinella arboricola]
MPIRQSQRFQRIHEQLRRRTAVPTGELMRLCGIAERTLKDDIAHLRERYGAPIRFNRRLGGYHYTRPFDLKTVEVELTDQDIAALRNAVATLNQFRDLAVFADFKGAVEKIEQAVRFRFSQPAPTQSFIIFEAAAPGQGHDLLDPLLVACTSRQVIQFQYQKYEDASARLRTVYPHLLKEHRNRWYLIGYELEPPQLRVFGLDRILSSTLNTTSIQFDPPLFDAEAYFRPALGVAVYDEPAEEVILSFTPKQGRHFQAQPFYPFQKHDVLVDTPSEFRVRLSIIINQELVFELARLGSSVQVRYPQRLIDALTEFHRRAHQQYTREVG